MKDKVAVIFGAVLLSLQVHAGPVLYGSPQVGEWTLTGGWWNEFTYYQGPTFFHADGPNYPWQYSLLYAELVKVVEIDKGLYQRIYTNALVYLYGTGPWVGCAPPPGPPESPELQYFKVLFNSMVMTVMAKESGKTQSVSFVLKGIDGELTGGGPGFRASLAISGSGGMGDGFGGGQVDAATITITGPVVDIKPGSEDNPVNVNARGVIPVAVYGIESAAFPDLMVLTLAGARVLGYSFEDGALILHYNTQDVAAGLGPVEDGQVVDVPLGYQLSPWALIVIGCDSVHVIKKSNK